jgi:hypothetical protein
MSGLSSRRDGAAALVTARHWPASRTVLCQGLGMAGAGLALDLGGGLALTRYLSVMLFGHRSNRSAEWIRRISNLQSERVLG